MDGSVAYLWRSVDASFAELRRQIEHRDAGVGTQDLREIREVIEKAVLSRGHKSTVLSERDGVDSRTVQAYRKLSDFPARSNQVAHPQHPSSGKLELTKVARCSQHSIHMTGASRSTQTSSSTTPYNQQTVATRTVLPYSLQEKALIAQAYTRMKQSGRTRISVAQELAVTTGRSVHAMDHQLRRRKTSKRADAIWETPARRATSAVSTRSHHFGYQASAPTLSSQQPLTHPRTGVRFAQALDDHRNGVSFSSRQRHHSTPGAVSFHRSPDSDEYWAPMPSLSQRRSQTQDMLSSASSPMPLLPLDCLVEPTGFFVSEDSD